MQNQKKPHATGMQSMMQKYRILMTYIREAYPEFFPELFRCRRMIAHAKYTADIGVQTDLVCSGLAEEPVRPETSEVATQTEEQVNVKKELEYEFFLLEKKIKEEIRENVTEDLPLIPPQRKQPKSETVTPANSTIRSPSPLKRNREEGLCIKEKSSVQHLPLAPPPPLIQFLPLVQPPPLIQHLPTAKESIPQKRSGEEELNEGGEILPPRKRSKKKSKKSKQNKQNKKSFCWNCGSNSHKHWECALPCCYGCGKQGITLAECPQCQPQWEDKGPYVSSVGNLLRFGNVAQEELKDLRVLLTEKERRQQQQQQQQQQQ